MKKLGYRKVEKFVKGHTAGKRLKWDLNPLLHNPTYKKQQNDCLRLNSSEAGPDARIDVQVVY